MAPTQDPIKPSVSDVFKESKQIIELARPRGLVSTCSQETLSLHFSESGSTRDIEGFIDDLSIARERNAIEHVESIRRDGLDVEISFVG